MDGPYLFRIVAKTESFTDTTFSQQNVVSLKESDVNATESCKDTTFSPQNVVSLKESVVDVIGCHLFLRGW